MPRTLAVTKNHLPPLSVTTQEARPFLLPHPERATLIHQFNTLQLIMFIRLWFMPT